MEISLNYRFILRVSGWLVLGTAIVSLLLLQVLEHHEEQVPLWGQKSIATDLLTFSFLLSFTLSLIATKLTHNALQAKRVLPLHWHLKSQTLIDRLPEHMLHRGFMFGLAGMLIACLTLLFLRLSDVREVVYQQYLILFVVHAVSLAGAITLMAVYRALGDRAMLQQAKIKKQRTSAK